MEEKCLKCGKVLFKKVQLDEKGNMAMDVNTQIPIEQEGADLFYKCPHCSAKNVLISCGPNQVKISRIKE